MTVREGEVEVTAQSAEEGEGNEIVPADYKGEEVLLGFNHQYLQEFLNNVGALENAGTVTAPATDGDTATNASTGDSAATAPARESKSPTRISFEFKDSNAATQIRISGDTAYDYKYIVMPLRI
jgi:DNA polymerase III sliding clamp (beta) subunit (PCNA family)